MSRARPLVLASLALAAACSDLTIEPAIDRITTAIDSPSLRNDIEPILQETCASSRACHAGANPQLGLNLEAGQAYGELVDVPSTWFGGMMRVRPGKPDSSLMLRALNDTASVRLGLTRMPMTRYPLPAAVQQTIRNWILNGAPNN